MSSPTTSTTQTTGSSVVDAPQIHFVPGPDGEWVEYPYINPRCFDNNGEFSGKPHSFFWSQEETDETDETAAVSSATLQLVLDESDDIIEERAQRWAASRALKEQEAQQ